MQRVSFWLCVASLILVGKVVLGQAICPGPTGSVLWSSYSWNGGVAPTPGSCITIATGTTVILDVSPPALTSLTIDGTLIFDCRPLTLTAAYILVRGVLEIGNSTTPFSNQATISLTTVPMGATCSVPEEQTLSVEGTGILRLHGTPRTASWARLGSTANMGQATLTMQSSTGWQTGDQIAIASTDFDTSQAEVHTIQSVSGSTITLASALAHMHWGATEGAALNGVGIEERAEVGLLNRTVKIQGTPYTTTVNSQIPPNVAHNVSYGGHVILQNPTSTTQIPRAEIDWAEFVDLGKEYVLGKYPIHFHQIGSANFTSWVKNSSIHHSFNRAISLHSTQGVTIENNVAYDVIGHTYYIEDNSVTGCVLNHNLGFGTRNTLPDMTLAPFDDLASTFWLLHPSNVIDNNAAAGSEGFGFWLQPIPGETAPPTSFQYNVSHSNMKS